jgi:uncharacterized membrane protein
MTIPETAGSGRGTATTVTVLGLAYPLLAHAAVLTRNPTLIATSIALLVLIVLLPGLRRRGVIAWMLLVATGISLFAIAGREQALLLLFLPPILINGFMAWAFGHTLQSGRLPLIERIIRILHGNATSVDSDIAAYARRLTLVWACLFVVMSAVNLALAMLARPGGILLALGLNPSVTVALDTWSLFANILNYLIVGAFFAVEYWFRRQRFPQQPYRGFFDFLRRLAGVSEVFRPASAGLRSKSGTEMDRA